MCLKCSKGSGCGGKKKLSKYVFILRTKIKTLNDGKKVMKVLLQELSMIVNSKQFELVRRCPSKVIFHHKTLQATRGRLIADALDNV